MEFEIIPAKEVDDYVGSPKTLIIDLREEESYKHYHIQTAINIPIGDLDRNQHQLRDYYQLILYCERGSKSLMAARQLSRKGYHVKNVYGGIQAYMEYRKEMDSNM